MSIQHYKTVNDVAEVAALQTVELLQNAIRKKGKAVWVLAGGSSPMTAYKIIANKYSHALDWHSVTVFVGDERFVPYDNPDSNWGAARPYIEPLGVTVVLPETTGDPSDSARAFAHDISPLTFDVVWLGVGEDGHTLSLFPNHPSSEPTDKLVIAVYDSPKPPSTRITITNQALKKAGSVIIFATGATKKDALQQALKGDTLPIATAATAVEAVGGEVYWLFDVAARGDK